MTRSEKGVKKTLNENIGSLLVASMWNWSCARHHGIKFFLNIFYHFIIASARRTFTKVRIRGIVPSVIAISPTMRCNYNCIGCYSRDRIDENELTTEEYDSLLKDAERFGISTLVVTGGEPFIRPDTLPLMLKHRNLLFVVITNGSFIDEKTAKCISDNGNIITLISIEGFIDDTDQRRKNGAHDTAFNAFKHLEKAGAFFGFAATNTAANIENLSSDDFYGQMVLNGCAVGFFSEYVPCGPDPRIDWVLNESQREKFRAKVLQIRRKQIVIVQFPHDEYGEKNMCSAAGRSSLHINSQGDVEPCPFVPVSCDNIRKEGLLVAFKSPFLLSIRKRPELLQRKQYACSLFEHLQEIKNLSEIYAKNTNEKEK
jgi:MoaA/NifB/PqqE/SkfB family radical SAM enzyme